MAYLAAKLKKLIFKPLQGLSVNFDLYKAALKCILKYEKLHNVGAMEPINIWNCKVVETRKNIYINNTCNLVPNKNVHMVLFQNYAHVQHNSLITAARSSIQLYLWTVQNPNEYKGIKEDNLF